MKRTERLRELLLGKPLDPFSGETRQHVVLVALLACIGLGADCLSSACYGPEESGGERVEAVALSHELRGVAMAVQSGGHDWPALEQAAMSALAQRGWKPDYIAIRRQADLGDVRDAGALVVLGSTRLIDNIELTRNVAGDYAPSEQVQRRAALIASQQRAFVPGETCQ
jgi:hypothetical protein